MNKRFGYPIYLCSLAGVTLLALLLRTLALFSSMDSIGYFDGGALPTLFSVLQILALIGCVAYPCLLKKDSLPQAAAPLSPISRAISGLAACLLALGAIFLLMHLADFEQRFLVLLAALFLAAGALYFLFQLLDRYEGRNVLAFGIILGAIFIISLTYFDLYTPMNAPRKTSLHLCLLTVMLYMLYELRMVVARPMPRTLAAVSAVCFFLTLSTGGSNLIYALSNGYTPLYLIGDLFSLSVGLYAGSRMVDVLLPPHQAEAPCEESPDPEPISENDDREDEA